MAQPLRVLVLRDGNLFFAQCLEINIAAQGASEDEAINNLHVAFRCETEQAQQRGTDLADLGPAPAAYQAMSDANIVGRTELQLVA
jgi:hypothetical protein